MSFRVSAWAIRNPIPVVSLFLALTLAGLVAYLQLPIKQFPNIDFPIVTRSEEHTSELQSLMRISYAVFCLKKKIKIVTTIKSVKTLNITYISTYIYKLTNYKSIH